MRVIFILAIVAFNYLLWLPEITAYDNNAVKMKTMLNTKQYIHGDTVIIIDYSALDGTYTLSNGLIVRKEIIEVEPLNKKDECIPSVQ